MNNNPQRYAKAIQQAKSGDEQAKAFLRLCLKDMASQMPKELLITLSEIVLDYRLDELHDEAARRAASDRN